MSSKISDACTKAAGAVYSRAVIQGVYAAMVVLGALIGQRWGVGGVAVAVSIAMGINWLTMAWLGRSVTGLSWTRFVNAHAPAALLATVLGGATLAAAQAARAASLGKIPVLLVAGITAGAVTVLASRLRPEVFLGPHGKWAWKRASELIRRGRHLAQVDRSGRSYAPAGRVNTK